MGAFVPGMNVGDLVASAATGALPQPGGAPQNMTTMGPAPLQAPQPLPRFQPPQVQYGKVGNEFQTASGRKRADQEALFHSIAGMIKSGGDYIQAKKNRMLQSSIERLMSAQAGIEEAKQMDPNDPKAKEAIAKNTAIINDITADPKTSKQLQKAFNIDLFGNGKNKNENQALVKAWQEFQQKQKAGDKTALNPIAQRLMQNQPIRQQLDPQAALQAQAIKLGLIPDANHQSTAAWQNLKSLREAQSKEEHDKLLQSMADKRLEAEKYKVDKQFDEAVIRSAGPVEAERIRAAAMDRRTSAMLKNWNDRNEILKGKEGNNPVFKSLSKEVDLYTKEMKLAQDNIKNARAQLDKVVKSGGVLGYGQSTDFVVKGPERAALEVEVKTNQAKIDYYTRMLNGDPQTKTPGVLGKLQMLSKMGMINTDENPDDPENMFPNKK